MNDLPLRQADYFVFFEMSWRGYPSLVDETGELVIAPVMVLLGYNKLLAVFDLRFVDHSL